MKVVLLGQLFLLNHIRDLRAYKKCLKYCSGYLLSNNYFPLFCFENIFDLINVSSS